MFETGVLLFDLNTLLRCLSVVSFAASRKFIFFPKINDTYAYEILIRILETFLQYIPNNGVMIAWRSFLFAFHWIIFIFNVFCISTIHA